MLTLTSTKKSSWKKDFHKRCWLWRDVSPTIKLVILQTLFPLVAQNGHKFHENGCEYYFHGWWLETKFLHDSNTMFFFCKGNRTKKIVNTQIHIWAKTTILSLVWKFNWASFDIKFQTFYSWWCDSIFQECSNKCHISCGLCRWSINNREQWKLYCFHK